MTKREDLPEAAVQPPPILTPDQDARRAEARRERDDKRAERGQPNDSAAADDPLRQPGEISSKVK